MSIIMQEIINFVGALAIMYFVWITISKYRNQFFTGNDRALIHIVNIVICIFIAILFFTYYNEPVIILSWYK